LRQARQKSEQLKRELRRKDKVLAEAAALLVLQKKVPSAVGGRGKMTTTLQRQHIARLINQACQSGVRLQIACKHIGMTCRTLQRWLRPSTKTAADALAPELALQQQKPQASVEAVPTLARAPESMPIPLGDKPVRADHRQAHLRQTVTPHNKLTAEECEALLAVANSETFKDLPPSQIVPRLADQGIYLGSESTLQRLLRSRHQNTHRRNACAPKKRHKPFVLKAIQVHQVYT
jgi:putative transposase